MSYRRLSLVKESYWTESSCIKVKHRPTPISSKKNLTSNVIEFRKSGKDTNFKRACVLLLCPIRPDNHESLEYQEQSLGIQLLSSTESQNISLDTFMQNWMNYQAQRLCHGVTAAIINQRCRAKLPKKQSGVLSLLPIHYALSLNITESKVNSHGSTFAMNFTCHRESGFTHWDKETNAWNPIEQRNSSSTFFFFLPTQVCDANWRTLSTLQTRAEISISWA